MEPLYSGHHWGMKFWPLQRGGPVSGGFNIKHNIYEWMQLGPRYISGHYREGGHSSGVPLYFQAHLEIARHGIDPSSCTGGTHMHKL